MCKVHCRRLISVYCLMLVIYVINHLLDLANILLFTELLSRNSNVNADNKRNYQCEYYFIYTVVTHNIEICPRFSFMYGTIPHTGVWAAVIVW